MKNSLLLLLTALIWGVAFVAQSVGGEQVGCFTFNGTRCLLGAAVLVPTIWVLDRKKKETEEKDTKSLLLGGTLCGIVMFAASNFQQYGLAFTTVGKAGFITALYIILVPLFGVFLKKRIGARVWISVVLAAAGLYLLCMTSERFFFTKGDLMVLVCAGFFSVHILLVDHFSPKCDGVRMSCIQFLVCGVLSMAVAFLVEEPSLRGLLDGWVPLAYAGVLSCGVGYTLQIVGQRDLDPTVASLLMSLESVFSVLAGWLILDQALSIREVSGCVLMFCAILLAQLPQREKEVQNL